MKFPPLSTIVFTIATVFLWFGIKIIGVTSGTNTQFVPQFSSAIFGITMGALIYLQIRLANRRRKDYSEVVYGIPSEFPKHEELMAVLSKSMSKKQNKKFEDDPDDDYYPILSEDSEENEDKLNEILDKIAESGKNSLSPYEIKFLEEYSRQL